MSKREDFFAVPGVDGILVHFRRSSVNIYYWRDARVVFFTGDSDEGHATLLSLKEFEARLFGEDEEAGDG